jgi:quinoprotein glucose dehydrogenase
VGWIIRYICVAALVVSLLGSAPSRGQVPAPDGSEWRSYASNGGSTKYSPLDQINRSTVKNLRIAWRQSAMPPETLPAGTTRAAPTNYQNTPLMVGGLLYVSTGLGTVAALDARTGKVVWADAPRAVATRAGAAGPGPPAAAPPRGSQSRGVAYWTDGSDARIIAVSGERLIALNAKTGKRYTDFGVGTEVDLTQGYERRVDGFRWSSPPLVVRDVVVVGGLATIGGRPASSAVRGFDVRTGKQLWIFHTIPRPGEYGNETWLNESWETAGATGVWGLMSADEELGYVYLPVETSTSRDPENNFYGGHRPGDALFGESLVCLDAKTGKRVWHFQAVHHGIWDYDFNAAPVLVDITVDGWRIKAVAQVSKQNFVYVFDRVTGEPIWPFEERPVPRGNIPGEWYSRTQPFPTKPPAYDQQGVTVDDLMDFTPELRAEALEIINQYRYGGLFTPSYVPGGPEGKKGTIQVPGTVSNVWNGAGIDPETGILYVPAARCSVVIQMEKPTRPGVRSEWVHGPGAAIVGPWLEGPRGLPDPFKPPYGRLVAFDLNKGEILWTVANGDGPRNHPALKDLNLPPLGQPGRAAPLVTKTMVFLGEGGNDGVPALPPGGGGKMFRAYDKTTGQVLWEMELPGGTTGAPMTYMVDGKQYIVVALGWKGMPGELVALALP